MKKFIEFFLLSVNWLILTIRVYVLDPLISPPFEKKAGTRVTMGSVLRMADSARRWLFSWVDLHQLT